MPGMVNGIYNPGQADMLFNDRIWPDTPVEWFVIGGPADANEAQTIVKTHPDIECIGFEPNNTMYDYQIKTKFPGKLYRSALWNKDGYMTFQEPHGEASHCGGLIRDYEDEDAIKYTVLASSLDSLSDEIGPWKNSILWLDIERAEMQALEGATKMLARGDVLLINLEVMEMSVNLPLFRDFLEPFRFKSIHKWNLNSNPDMCDAIFRLEK